MEAQGSCVRLPYGIDLVMTVTLIQPRTPEFPRLLLSFGFSSCTRSAITTRRFH